MQSISKAGYKNKISQFVISCLDDNSDDNEGHTEDIDIDALRCMEKKYAVALQSAWRSRIARIHVSALKQEKDCYNHRMTHPTIEKDGTQCVATCDTCSQGDPAAELKQKIMRLKFREIEKLLFTGRRKITINDSGDNWNQRYQRIISMPENTPLERSAKYSLLSMLNHDFVNTAKSYAQTIISEYFLHIKDKSIVAKDMGGVAGGKKYMWRGILFKMADGSSGPYNGSDEAASKAAGHDLKGSIHYYNCGVKELHLPLMALIDYKGFRMSAQAFLPLGEKSLVYGSADGGRTVHKSNEKFNDAMRRAAEALNIRGHVVGKLDRAQELHAAVDIEGHVGMDNRFYLLDMSRTFPPESPTLTTHLDDLYEDGSIVLIRVYDPNFPSRAIHMNGTVHRAYSHGRFYDILFEDGSVAHRFPASRIQRKSLSIFWRLLRPEYVKDRGKGLIPLNIEDVDRDQNATSSHSVSHVDLIEENKTKEGPPGVLYDDFETNGETDRVNASPCRDSNASPDYDEFDTSTDNLSNTKETPEYDSFDEEHNSIEYDQFEDTPVLPGGEMDECEEVVGADTIGEIDQESPLKESINDKYDEVSKPNTPVDDKYDEESLPGDYGAFDWTGSGDVYEDEQDCSGSGTDLSPAPLQGEVVASAISKLTFTKGANKHKSHSFIEREVDILEHYDIYSGGMGVTSKSNFDMTRKLADPDASPAALSPDALSAFSNFDPYAPERNREVTRATERLMKEVIPAVALDLTKLKPIDICSMNFSVYFHFHGVNIRHMGLVRSHIPAEHSNIPIRTALLLQIVTRTLKNIAREFQRRWMKSEQSTSEQGMFILLTQFVNLVVGSHENSEEFWSERVFVGIIQRFGGCAIDNNIDHLQRVRKRPQFLKAMLKKVLDMIGLKLKEKVMNEFMCDPDPYEFEFDVQDIASLEAKVKYMHIVDFGTGLMLQEMANNRSTLGDDPKIIARLRSLANEHFLDAERAMPTHKETMERTAKIKEDRRREFSISS